MKRLTFVVFVLVLWLATCSAPQLEAPALEIAPTQTSLPPTLTPALTAFPPTPTETAAPQAKLPAAPFDAETYTDEEAGFAFEYPTGWTVNEMVIGSRGAQVQFLSAPGLAEAAAIPAGETRLTATIYQWDPKNDLDAYVQHWKDAWSGSGFTVLDEQALTLELGLPAVEFTVQTPESQVVFLVTALQDQYLVLSGEGDLELAKQIMERLRPISN
jgi:hypothetical protein